MKLRLPVWVLLLLCMMLSDACKPKLPAWRVGQTVAWADSAYAGRQLTVAHGGGFTGFSTTYQLLDNGRLLRRKSPDKAYTYVGKLAADTTRSLFKTIEKTCQIQTTDYDRPGNRYTRIRWQKGAATHQVVWGQPDGSVPDCYPAFYKTFMAAVAPFETATPDSATP